MTTGRTVRVATFNSEPLARLWENTLREEGIPAMARPLSGGPGVLGQTANLPHGLYVDAADEENARYLLGTSAEPPADDAEEPRWSFWYWPPFVRAIAFVFLLIVVGALIIEIYSAIAHAF